jgi:hypothetical protein
VSHSLFITSLLPKKIFRMSGPVVAIGFILLIPSVLGMVAAGLMFFGVIAVSGIGLSHNTNTTADVELRRACINIPESDTAVPQPSGSNIVNAH